MTLETRNTFLILGLFISALVVLAACIGLTYIYLKGILPGSMPAVLPPLALSLVSSVAALLIYLSFRKTLSAEITLFIVFLVLTSLDILKPGGLVIRFYQGPLSWSITLTRIVYLFRFSGIFCFMSAGLFAAGLPSQRLSITLGICFFLAFLFSLILPIDSSIREDNFILRVGLHSEIQTGMIILEIIAVVNYIIALGKTGEKALLLTTLGAALTISGREILFFQQGLLIAIPAFIFFCVGILLYAKKIHQIYLWK
ncbi:MAG: hypothetical protein JW760_02945 [Spirochaetales bacterium]|nr:hypothetical protein [Spirochaetales bacterium]